MNKSLSVIENFKQINVSSPFNKYIAMEKEKGKKIIGWLCSYIPEEIIHSAGAFPMRVMGKEEIVTGDSEAYLYSNTCSFVRACLEVGLRGDYGFLDGLVCGSTCDHIRRFYEVWERYVEIPYHFFLSIPHKTTDHGRHYFKKELERFVGSIQEITGIKVDDQSLKASIDLFNKTRELLKEIYSLRTAETPVITGAEMHEVLNACTRIPREDYNLMLKRLLDELDSRPPVVNPGAIRYLVSGSHLDSTFYINDIEKMGGIVVADELCTGSNYFWDLIDSSLPPLEALSLRYLTHTPCARMRPENKRLSHMLHLIDTHQVDGVVFIKIKFCDLYAFDGFMFKEALKDKDVPVLELEREYHQCPSGQMQTRIQAFMEMIEVKKCKKTF